MEKSSVAMPCSLPSGKNTDSSHFKQHIRIYLGVLAFFFVAAILFAILKPSFNFMVSDGKSYYMYLPSIFIDGDLDFSNEIREHWGPEFKPSKLERRTPTGLVANKYPIGFALSLAPSFLMAHGLSAICFKVTGVGFFFPDGYSVIYQILTLAAIQGYGLCMFLLIDRILQHQGFAASSRIFGILTTWICSPYAYYYFREPVMVHVVSSFWVTSAIYLCLRPPERTRKHASPALLSLAVGMAVICRPTNGLVVLPFLIAWCWQSLRLRAVPALAIGAIPLGLQMVVWNTLYGNPIFYTYGGEGFHLQSPALLETLISSKHGLFFWSPLTALAMAGILLGLRNQLRMGMVVKLIASFSLLWYFNSSWGTWWFGDAFGARAFLELSIVFAFGLAIVYERCGQSPFLRGVLATFVLFCFCYNYLLMGLYISHRIPRADYLF